MAPTSGNHNIINLHKDLPEVIVLEHHPVLDACHKQFSQRFQLVKAWESHLPLAQFLGAHAHSARALLCPSGGPRVDAAVLGLLPHVGLVATTSSGVDHVDLAECRKRGVAVANARDVFSADVADMAVGMLIDVMRKVSVADRFTRDGRWHALWKVPYGCRMGGKRVGIVGLGSVGMEIASRLEAFRCRISYYARKEKDEISYPFYSDVRQLAAESDVLVICCRLTEQTRHMVDRSVLLALGKDGFVVNIGRGKLVKEEDLVECLANGEIAGAALDVFENEPHVPKELVGMENVVLSPHRGVLTPEGLKDLCELVIGNLEAFFSSRPLLSPFGG